MDFEPRWLEVLWSIWAVTLNHFAAESQHIETADEFIKILVSFIYTAVYHIYHNHLAKLSHNYQ